MEHIHEVIVDPTTDTIKCRNCNQIFDQYEERIARVQSATQARHIMDEIAGAGGYTASTRPGGFIVYSRDLSDRITEEVTARKIADRVFHVVKTLRVKEQVGGEK